MNFANPQEHVPEAKRKNCVIIFFKVKQII